MFRRITLAAATTALFVTPALATTIFNKDSSSYDIAYSSGSSWTKTSINGKTTKGACSSSASTCKIKVEGVGEIEVSGSDDVVIKNGRLEKK